MEVKDGVPRVPKRGQELAKTALAKFKVPSKVRLKTPYVPPAEKDLFQYTEKTERDLCKDLVESGGGPLLASRVRHGEVSQPQERLEVELGPPRRRTSATPTQPQSASDYLSAVRTTARDKNLARVAEVESQRLKKELEKEVEVNNALEYQLHTHQTVLQKFLQHHYSQVTDAITKGDSAERNLKQQEIRIDYYSGLLTESQTVQQEEQERLQELTAFQQFLTAVTPLQSLQDLTRRLQELQTEAKMVTGGEDGSCLASSSSALDLALAANTSVNGTSGGEGGGLSTDLLALRMLNSGAKQSRPTSKTDPRCFVTHPGDDRGPKPISEDATVPGPIHEDATVPGPIPEDATAPRPILQDSRVPQSISQDSSIILQDGPDSCDVGAFDKFLGDESHLLSLACVYESQCHSLLALLTRLRAQTEAISAEVGTRQRKLGSRLQEVQELQQRARVSGHQDQLKDLRSVIEEWPRLSGDAVAQNQLDQLVAQIAEVVSDVFGSSEYSPLVPETTSASSAKKQPVKTTAVPKSGEVKPEATEMTSVPLKPAVSAGMGQEALLALLEARVTDLCAQLDNIDPKLRDVIFQSCEQSRKARVKEEKKLEAEVRRAERKRRHLERALAEPPAKPL
ncbi:uncharacterized protein [Cherax quadricarinatus]|uniref:uncharacterized protein n=1 Tax=Cherax quadricarinatus TaxID=27406 RepID=UPI00387E706C